MTKAEDEGGDCCPVQDWEKTFLGWKMKKEAITTNKAFVSKSPLAQAIKAGNMLFISGQVPVDSNTMKVVSEDFATQARHVLESLKAIRQRLVFRSRRLSRQWFF